MTKKIAYSKLTFMLSVIGFLGSLGFYFGVLREVYSDSEKENIEVIKELKTENKKLKNQISVLTQLIKTTDEQSKSN